MRRPKKRVLITGRLHPFAIRELEKRFAVTVNAGAVPMPGRRLLSGIRDVEGIICFPYDRIGRKEIDAARNLRVISTYSVGFDHIDVEYAKKRRIRVGYTPDVLTDATADLTIALMLDCLRRVSEGDRIIRGGRWRRVYGPYEHVGRDTRGRTLGILGMGRIGGAVAARAAAFGMRVVYHNRTRLSKSTEDRLKAGFVTMGGLVSKSDVLSLHVPHTPETDGMIGRTTFQKMKRSAFLINTARGRIVNQGDLVRALRQKEIAGAGLDVFESEPIGGDDELCRMDNVVLVPHMGSSTEETRHEMAALAVRNLKMGIRNRKPACSVGY